MSRVKMIPPETTDDDVRKVYDGVLKQWGRISNFSQVLAHQPAALAGWMLPNESIRLNNVKTDPDYVKIQQLVIIKTSALNGSAYCMSHNVPLGRKIGLTDAQIAAAQGDDYMASPDLDERQKAAVRWAEAVTRMTARDDDDGVRRDEAALQREADRRADGVLRDVELLEPAVRSAARRPGAARQAHRIPADVAEAQRPDLWTQERRHRPGRKGAARPVIGPTSR